MRCYWVLEVGGKYVAESGVLTTDLQGAKLFSSEVRARAAACSDEPSHKVQILIALVGK